MEIVKSYWGCKLEQKISENQFLNHINNFEIKNVFIAFKKIENFKITIENDRMIIKYSLRKNSTLKYYCNLLNHSIALKENTAIFLQDANWHDYKNQILNQKTINLLN